MLPEFHQLPANDPAKAGQLASPKQRFGAFGRYAIAPLHQRLGHQLVFFVWDAHACDQYDPKLPAVVRQEEQLEDALRGLDLRDEAELFEGDGP